MWAAGPAAKTAWPPYCTPTLSGMGKSITLAAIRSTATTARPAASPRLIQMSGLSSSSLAPTRSAKRSESTGQLHGREVARDVVRAAQLGQHVERGGSRCRARRPRSPLRRWWAMNSWRSSRVCLVVGCLIGPRGVHVALAASGLRDHSGSRPRRGRVRRGSAAGGLCRRARSDWGNAARRGRRRAARPRPPRLRSAPARRPACGGDRRWGSRSAARPYRGGAARGTRRRPARSRRSARGTSLRRGRRCGG